MSTTKIRYPHTPDYIRLLPPGEIITEKIFEMGINAEELAKRCEISVEIIQKFLKAEIELTVEMAEKLEQVTWIPAETMMKFEKSYRQDLRFLHDNPDYPTI